MVRLSSAVCAIIGVCTLDMSVPFCSRKLLRCGISSRSDGTFGLSRNRCTLSNTIETTCETPLPSWHVDGAADASAFILTATTPPVAARIAADIAPITRVRAARDPNTRDLPCLVNRGTTRQPNDVAVPMGKQYSNIRSAATCACVAWVHCGLFA